MAPSGARPKRCSISPDDTVTDWTDEVKGLGCSPEGLWCELTKLDLSTIKRIGCPVMLFEGRHDLNVNAVIASRWFDQLQAPSKKLVWFEDCAHRVFEDDPGKTLIALQRNVLPLTQ